MILELNGTKVTIVDKTLGYQGDNLVNTIQVTVDKDSTWNYKLDMYKGFCSIYAKEALKRAYHAYHELHGNDVATGLYNEVMALPTEVRE